MEYDTGLAKRAFPARAQEIDELAARCENFRDLCNDFALADELKRTWETSTAPERDERYAESAELFESLRKEIEEMVEQAKVVPFPGRR
jgi:hypothetical protein